MSRIALTSMAQAKIEGRVVADVSGTLKRLTGLPAGIAGALDELLYDMVVHHRTHTAVHHKLPGGRRSQKYIYSRTWAHARNLAKRGVVPPLSQLGAESFAAAVGGETFGHARMAELEFGGVRASREFMAIPIGAGRRLPDEEFRRLLASRELQLAKQPGILFRERTRGTKNVRLVASDMIAVLRKSRVEKPMLGFYSAWDRVAPKHMATLERFADLAVDATDAEFAKLTASAQLNRIARTEFARAYGAAKAEKATPQEARRIARRAATQAKKLAQAKIRGDA